MNSVSGKVIMVAGGSGGIGAAVSRLLCREGATVLSIRFRSPALEPEPGMISLQADLRSPAHWQRVLHFVCRQFGAPDVLVNCAGLLVPGTLATLSPRTIRDVLESNIHTVVYGIRSVLPAMMERGKGHLITLGSLGGIVPMPFEALYSAAKFAVRGFCLSLGEELRGTGITSSLLSLGPVETKMLSCEAADEHSAITFLTRPLSPEDVARSVLHILIRPREEVLLPFSPGCLAAVLGGWPQLFGFCFHLLRPLGAHRQRNYLKREMSQDHSSHTNVEVAS